MSTRSVFLGLAATGLLAGFMPAGFAESEPVPPGAAEATLRRPTDFRSRAEIRHEYQDLPAHGYRNLVIPRFEYAVQPSLALRVETPYVFYDPGSAAGERVSGRGDVMLRGAWRATQHEGFALILVTELFFDTASDPQLGLGKTIVAPLVYAAIDWRARDSVFFPNLQHYSSVAGDETRRDVSQTVLKPNLLTRWPDKVYTFLEPQVLIDWERNAKVGFMVELEFGKLVSQNAALWVRPGVGVVRNDLPQIYRWNMEIGARYIF